MPNSMRAALVRGFWSVTWLFGLPAGSSILLLFAAHRFGWIDAVEPWHLLAAFAAFEMVALAVRDRRASRSSRSSVPRARRREDAKAIGIAVAIALLFRGFVVEAYEIPSGSMVPTLEVGDHVFVNKFVLGLQIPWTNVKLFEHVREPRRGEVIVFRHPRETSKDLIKRIVGIAGDEIEMRGTQLVLNGRPVPRCFAGEYSHERRRSDLYVELTGGIPHVALYDRDHDRWDGGSWRVPSGEVFVMGDNRDDSSDSRYWGGVPLGNIKGRAMFIWWSNAPTAGVRVDRIGRSIMGEPEIATPLQANVRRCLRASD